jgi:hypothetical protein
VAFPHTLQFMYGAPEYGGNRDLVGWEFTNYDGDVQPRGYSREEVEQPDDPGPLAALPQLPAGVSETRLQALAAMASPKAGHGLVVTSGGSLEALTSRTEAMLAGVAGLDERRAAPTSGDRRGGRHDRGGRRWPVTRWWSARARPAAWWPGSSRGPAGR